MNLFGLFVIIVVWMVAIGMIESHDVGTNIVGYTIALGCGYATIKIFTSGNNDREKK